MAAYPGTENVRLSIPTHGPTAVAVKKEVPQFDQFGEAAPTGWKRRHQGLLQDKLRRAQRGPFTPSLSLAFRILLLIRTGGAMYSLIQDCDEVFNFFEPLHYFSYNSGFQTWELSPEFAVRSWAYVLLHWPLAHVVPMILRLGKRQAFFSLRIALGAICSFCEAKFYRTVVETVNERGGKYMLFSMMFSAGMWGAATAFLPSSFAMYTTMLAYSYAFNPATSTVQGTKWAYRATFLFGLGAIVGWPFSAALGIPFVYEQLFLTGGEVIPEAEKGAWRGARIERLGKAIGVAACIAIPVSIIDSWAYGRSVFPTLNIILYNIFNPEAGPSLYGTSPASFYFQNLFLNFNFLLPLALVSLPVLALTWKYDHRRLGKTQQATKEGETSPYTLLILRLVPFYLWLLILSAQSHKEERFFFPAYPLLCFNAAVSVYLLKGLMEAYYIKLTNSPYEASRRSFFSWFSTFLILIPAVLSIFRIYALGAFYRAPFTIVHHFEYQTIPSILSDLGYSPLPPPPKYQPRKGEVMVPEWDLSPLLELEPKVTLCYGAEWYRFPGSYLVPQGIDVRWIKSGMDGMMPRPWEVSEAGKGRGSWPRPETRRVRVGRFNGLNKPSEEPGTFVPIEQCNYLVHLSLPSTPPTAIEPDYSTSSDWEREYCTTFLDAQASKWWSRLIYLPGGLMDRGRVYGRYCLMKRK